LQKNGLKEAIIANAGWNALPFCKEESGSKLRTNFHERKDFDPRVEFLVQDRIPPTSNVFLVGLSLDKEWIY